MQIKTEEVWLYTITSLGTVLLEYPLFPYLTKLSIFPKVPHTAVLEHAFILSDWNRYASLLRIQYCLIDHIKHTLYLQPCRPLIIQLKLMLEETRVEHWCHIWWFPHSKRNFYLRVSIAVKRHQGHDNSYKRKHLMGWMTFSEVWSIIIMVEYFSM